MCDSWGQGVFRPANDRWLPTDAHLLLLENANSRPQKQNTKPTKYY